VHAALKPVTFDPQPANGFFVLPLLVGVADPERVAHSGQSFLIEGQLAEDFREPLFGDLFAHVGFLAPATTSCRCGGRPPAAGSPVHFPFPRNRLSSLTAWAGLTFRILPNRQPLLLAAGRAQGLRVPKQIWRVRMVTVC
jgi:hypothetical protein